MITALRLRISIRASGDDVAHPASGACVRVKFQGYYVFEIDEAAHFLFLQKSATIHKTISQAQKCRDLGWDSPAHLFLYTGKRSEVEHPVKFIAR